MSVVIPTRRRTERDLASRSTLALEATHRITREVLRRLRGSG